MALWLPKSLVITNAAIGPTLAPPMLCLLYSSVLLGLSTQQELKFKITDVRTQFCNPSSGVGNPGGIVDKLTILWTTKCYFTEFYSSDFIASF